ncbi:hypothetical protein AAVH_15791 [Aphelenchoides avenae]|nr:hypothetical protein AAVH_15791 [Aphelenchus avenae]
MKKAKTPRPYIKSSLRLDLHTEDNAGSAADALQTIAAFLVDAGFRRPKVKRRPRPTKGEAMKTTVEVETPKIEEKSPEVREEKPSSSKNQLAHVGLRSVLREVNRSSLAAVCLDAELVRPTALANVLSLAALSNAEKCPFYVLQGLTSIGAQLNMPKVTAVGFTPAAGEVLEAMREKLQPIGTTAKKRSSVGATFATPQMSTPVGKPESKRRKKKNKQKQPHRTSLLD